MKKYTQGFIYYLYDPEDEEIRYVGKTVQNIKARLSSHNREARQSNKQTHRLNWIRKLHSQGLEPKIVICETICFSGLKRRKQIKVLNKAEKFWIKNFGKIYNLTNMTLGGDGCHGRKLSKETLELIRLSNLGQKRTSISKKLMSASAKARDPSTRLCGKNHQHFGKSIAWKNPKERIAKIKNAWTKEKRIMTGLLQTPMSAEEIKKQSIRHRGVNNCNSYLTEDVVIKIFKSKKPGIFLAKKYDTTPNVISRIRNQKTWKYLTSSINF